MLDMNTADEQRKFGDVIPDGTFVKLQINIRAGGSDLPGQDAMDNGLFKASTKSDAVMLDCEFTVLEPPEFAHRKLFENWTVAGGALDEKGVSKGWNMTKSRIRAMLESATGTSPKDLSAQAKANRQVGGFKQLDDCPFFAKLYVEIQTEVNPQTGRAYAPKNLIDYIVTPDEPEYSALRAGQRVEPKPRNAPHAPGGFAGGTTAKPAWGGAAAPAAPPAAAKPAWQQPASAPAAAAPAPAPAAPATPPAASGPAWLSR